MDISHLNVAQAAVWFYYGHIVAQDARPGDFAGVPANTVKKFALGYEQSVREVRAVFLRAPNREGSNRFAH
jgi:hypothetical protein